MRKIVLRTVAASLAFLMAVPPVYAEDPVSTSEPAAEPSEEPATAPTPESTTAAETVSPDPTVTPEETAATEPTVSPTAESAADPTVKTSSETELSIDWTSALEAINSGTLYQTENMTIGTLNQISSLLSKPSVTAPASGPRYAPRRASGQLITGGEDSVYSTYTVNGKERWSSPMSLNGRPAYCIEPGVNTGINYDSELALSNYDHDTVLRIGRIMWYGYGHPLTGSDPLDYEATQLLIWKYTVPDKYAEIIQTYTVCPTLPSNINACTLATGIGPSDIQERMDKIMNLVENHDKVPSFANEWHGTEHFDLDWNETLTLTDTNGVMDWFNEYSEESHPGINVKRDGDSLKIDIDSLYYSSHDSAEGQTLTFKRKDDQWTNYLNGILIWRSPGKQSLAWMALYDPTPQYSLSVSLNRANIEITKLDEYGNVGNFTAGTQFYVGWNEDPETQYENTGDNDDNWTDLHDENKVKKDDVDGMSNVTNGTTFYYPIMTEDGSSVRIFTVGDDGKLHIDGLLPTNKKWWIREVNATNPFTEDDRVFSVSTGGTGTTTSKAFANGLRDITLSLVKKDEDDTYTKINGATYRIYEVGNDLDLSKDPTEYGNEVNLNRLKNPTLTYAQLKENTNLQKGDVFLFNGYIYEITDANDNSWTVTATKASEYNMHTDDVFSRYQFLKAEDQDDIIGFTPADTFQKNAAYTVYDIAKRHATYATDDDEKTDRKMTVTDLCSNLGGETPPTQDPAESADPGEADGEEEQEPKPIACTITVKENRSVSETFNASTSPSYDAFKAAAESAGVELAAGNTVTLNGVSYTINTVSSDSITASPERIYEVDLTNAKPSYYDIPNVRDLKAGDTFTLTYPETVDGKTFTEEQQKFTVTEANAYTLTIQTVPEDPDETPESFTYTVPNWIDFEDIPSSAPETETFTITGITLPTYTVKDSRGNEYLVKSSGTEVLTNASGDAAMTDIDYLAIIGSFTTDPDTGEQIEDASGLTESGCLDPVNAEGCPFGTERTKTFTRTETMEYTGPQYADAVGGETPRSVNDTFTADPDETEYTVLEVDDSSITLGFLKDDKIWTVTLEKDAQTTEAVHVEPYDVTFTVEDSTPKEFDVRWNNINVPVNSLTADGNFHLSPTGNDTGLITWEAIPNKAAAAGTTFTDANGIEWKILYNDTVNHVIVVHSIKGRYTVTPERKEDSNPASWQNLIDQETERGTTFRVNETFNVEWHKQLQRGDTFSIAGIPYTVLSHEYTTENGVTKLNDPTAHIYSLIFPWEKDAPYNYTEASALAGTNTEFTDGGVTYSWTQQQINGNNVYVLVNKGTGDTWTYSTKTLTASAGRFAPYEQQEPGYVLTIIKPSDVTYDQMKAAALDTKEAGDRFTLNGVTYTVTKIEDVTEPQEQQKITLEDTDGNEVVLYEKETPVENPDAADDDKETVATFTFDQYTAAPKLEEAGDSVTVDGTKYTILKTGETQNHGKMFRIRSTKDGTTMDVYESPDSNYYDTERVYTLRTNTEYNLTNLYPGAQDMRLQSGNYHVTLTKEENPDGSQTVRASSDAITSAVLLLLDKNGYVTDTKQLVFSDTGTEGSTDGLPIFEGETGKQYLRIVDPLNHNTPVPYGDAKVYTDAAKKQLYKEVTADKDGVVDVSDWPAGTYYYTTARGEGTVTVVSPEEMTGQLKISGLKWGRTYMACEFSLPDGYDYGDQEVCHTFTMNADSGTDVINAEALNKLRHLKLKVYKVDQENTSTLLNGAWFTVSDVTGADTVIDEHESSTFKERITLSDIPSDAEPGDEVIVWRAKSGGKIHRYRILNIAADSIQIELFDNNKSGTKYNVPVKGISSTAPMLYSDIVRGVSPLKKGAVFTITEKEPQSAAQFYEVLAVTKTYGTDAFGKPTENKVISTATVVNTKETNAEPIVLKAVESNETYPTEAVGKYVSGGIFTEITEEVNSLPVSWADIVTAAGGTENIAEGTEVPIQQRTTAAMPSYNDLEMLTGKKLSEIADGDSFTYQGVTYTVGSKLIQTAGETTTYTIYLDALGSRYTYRPDTIAGAVEYTAAATGRVTRLYQDENGTVNAVTIEDANGNSYYVTDKDVQQTVVAGKPGSEVIVSKNEDLSNPVYIGYTDGNGQLVLNDVPDGMYFISRNGTVTEEQVEKGLIYLPDVEYGHKLQVCETKSPVGYMIGNACEIVGPTADYSTDVVTNFRTNAKIRRRRTIQQARIRRWRMDAIEE